MLRVFLSCLDRIEGRKRGQHHEMPVHHTLEEYLDSYIEAAGLWDDKKGPLFRATNGKTGVLSSRPLDREDAFHMIRRRARQARIETKIGCHTFRANRDHPST
jgi:integrase/recombinase XerD